MGLKDSHGRMPLPFMAGSPLGEERASSRRRPDVKDCLAALDRTLGGGGSAFVVAAAAPHSGFSLSRRVADQARRQRTPLLRLGGSPWAGGVGRREATSTTRTGLPRVGDASGEGMPRGSRDEYLGILAAGFTSPGRAILGMSAPPDL